MTTFFNLNMPLTLKYRHLAIELYTQGILWI